MRDLAHLTEASPVVYRYQGVFSTRDQKKYFQFPFEVKEGATKIYVHLQYNKEPKNILYLQLYDYRRFRGIGKYTANIKKNEIEIFITPTCASPGALFGNIPKGRWIAEIDSVEVFAICKYHLSIEIYYDNNTVSRFAIKKPTQKKHIVSNEKRWYRGDLHIHSQESDGKEPVKEIIKAARENRLDFIAITDHNTISSWQYFKRHKDILLIPGVEVTTPRGHANALGIDDWIDWRIGYRNRTIFDIIKDTRSKGGIFCINHPRILNHNGHVSWNYQGIDYHQVDAIEIWNAPWLLKNTRSNEMARSLWNDLLNQGYRLTAVAGSDLHSFDLYAKRLGSLLNYIYCENLSQEALLQGIKSGKVFMTAGPMVDFNAIYKGKTYMIGEEIVPSENQVVEFHIGVTNTEEELELRIIQDGYILKKYSCPPKEKLNLYFEKVVHDTGWYRIELHHKITDDEEDSLVAITNPIYIVLSSQ